VLLSGGTIVILSLDFLHKTVHIPFLLALQSCTAATPKTYMTKTDEWLNSTFRALNIPSDATFGCTSSSRWGMFMKISICGSAIYRYKRCDFGCNYSTIKGTLLKEQRTSSAINRIPLDEFYW